MIFILRCLRSWEVVKNWKEMLPPKWQEILLHICYHRLFKTKVFDYHWAVRSIWIDWLKQQTRSERIARLAQLLATEWQSPYGLEKIIQTMITLKIIKRYCWCSEFHPTPVAMQNFPVHLHMFCVSCCFSLIKNGWLAPDFFHQHDKMLNLLVSKDRWHTKIWCFLIPVLLKPPQRYVNLLPRSCRVQTTQEWCKQKRFAAQCWW